MLQLIWGFPILSREKLAAILEFQVSNPIHLITLFVLITFLVVVTKWMKFIITENL